MARLGPARFASDENIRQLETTSRTNRHIKVRELLQMSSISVGTDHYIIYSCSSVGSKTVYWWTEEFGVLSFDDYTKLLPIISLDVLTRTRMEVYSESLHNLQMWKNIDPQPYIQM